MCKCCTVCICGMHLSLQINKHMCTQKISGFILEEAKIHNCQSVKDSTGPRSPWEGQFFALTGADTYSGYGFASPACNASAKTTCGLTEHLIRCHGILRGTASHQGTHFTKREVCQWAHDRGVHWFYQAPHHPEAAGLIERWNCLSKKQLECQLGSGSHRWLVVGRVVKSIRWRKDVFLT